MRPMTPRTRCRPTATQRRLVTGPAARRTPPKALLQRRECSLVQRGPSRTSRTAGWRVEGGWPRRGSARAPGSNLPPQPLRGGSCRGPSFARWARPGVAPRQPVRRPACRTRRERHHRSGACRLERDVPNDVAVRLNNPSGAVSVDLAAADRPDRRRVQNSDRPPLSRRRRREQ